MKLLKCIYSRIPLESGYEKHHIVPQSWSDGDVNEYDNIIRVTSKEHFVIHHLMSRAFHKDRSMALAYWFLSRGHILNALEYARVRSIVAEGMRDRNMGRSSWNSGIALSDAHKKRLSDAKLGKAWTEERRNAHKSRIGKTFSEETRQKISEKARGRMPSIETRERLSAKKIGSRWVNNRKNF